MSADRARIDSRPSVPLPACLRRIVLELSTCFSFVPVSICHILPRPRSYPPCPRRYAAGVDLVLSGHVHAFERTHPLYKYKCAVILPSLCSLPAGILAQPPLCICRLHSPMAGCVRHARRVDTCGPMYLTIGDGGNIEGPYR